MAKFSGVVHQKKALTPELDSFIRANFARFDVGYTAHNFCLLIEMFNLRITDVALALGKTRKTIYQWRMEGDASKPSAKDWNAFIDYLALLLIEI